MFLLTGSYQSRTLQYRFDQSVVLLGRAHDNDLRLADRYASAHHCMILNFDGRFLVRDRNSRNGTRVAGRWVHGEVPIGVGQEIHIGETILLLQLETEGGLREAPLPLGLLRLDLGTTPPQGHRLSPFKHAIDDFTYEQTPVPGQTSSNGTTGTLQIRPAKTPTRASLRSLIEHVIHHAPQLRALLVDYFPDLAKQIPPDMERLSVVSLILEREPAFNVLRCVQLAFPQECAEHWALIRWE